MIFLLYLQLKREKIQAWECINSQISYNSDVSLSAGNTGKLLVMSKMILKTLEGIDKPALAGLWPNNKI